MDCSARNSIEGGFRVPVKSALSELHWLSWGVPFSGSTGYVLYPFACLSNLLSESGARASPLLFAARALGNTPRTATFRAGTLAWRSIP